MAQLDHRGDDLGRFRVRVRVRGGVRIGVRVGVRVRFSVRVRLLAHEAAPIPADHRTPKSSTHQVLMAHEAARRSRLIRVVVAEWRRAADRRAMKRAVMETRLRSTLAVLLGGKTRRVFFAWLEYHRHCVVMRLQFRRAERHHKHAQQVGTGLFDEVLVMTKFEIRPMI